MAISCSLKSMVSQPLQKIGQVIHLCNVTLRRTRRGTRAGIRVQREIRVFTSKNCRDQNLTCYIQQGVNINNLIKLPLVNTEGFLKSGGETIHKEKVLKKHSRSIQTQLKGTEQIAIILTLVLLGFDFFSLFRKIKI